MYFELEVAIERKPAEVFAFMRDKDLYPQKPGSKVLALEKLTPGKPGVGTRYREVVQMLPFFRGTILSEITRFEVPHRLEESFAGAGMRGSLAYEFVPRGAGTVLKQRETIEASGILRIVAPLVWHALGPRLLERLHGIKAELDAGWVVQFER